MILGEFDYDQLYINKDSIRTCISKYKNNDWIYIGEMKEGTDDIPHGIGIKVWDHGGTQQLNMCH